MNDVTRRGHPFVFGALIVFSIIEICIAAWITAKYNANHNFPDTGFQNLVRFVLFTSIWTVVLGSMYLMLFICMAGNAFTSVVSHFVFLFVTWIFWVAAAASLTNSLGGTLNCNTQDTFAYCGHLNALEGFAWLIVVLMSLMLLFVLIRGIMGQRRGEGFTAPMVEV